MKILFSDVVWYHNDQIVRNTERIKIRIQDTRTTLTIKDVTVEDHGMYVCKAVSDIGMAVTKATLDVKEISDEEKKVIRLRKAQEQKEKIKKEKVTIEKKRKERKERIASLTTEPELKPVDVQEIHPIEKTEHIEETRTVETAEEITTIQDHVTTEATATCKKIDQPEEEIEELFDTAKPQVEESPLDEAKVTEVKLQELIEKVEELIVHEEIKMAREVKEVLELVKAKEFGPGENPLRELAEIGYLHRSGITVREITVLYGEDKFPHLKTPEAQNAMVNVVDRKGHGPLISEVLTEESIDEKVLAATVGFRAFMKMVELKHATVEEVLTEFKPEDFTAHAWEATETKEVG